MSIAKTVSGDDNTTTSKEEEEGVTLPPHASLCEAEDDGDHES